MSKNFRIHVPGIRKSSWYIYIRLAVYKPWVFKYCFEIKLEIWDLQKGFSKFRMKIMWLHLIFIFYSSPQKLASTGHILSFLIWFSVLYLWMHDFYAYCIEAFLCLWKLGLRWRVVCSFNTFLERLSHYLATLCKEDNSLESWVWGKIKDCQIF